MDGYKSLKPYFRENDCARICLSKKNILVHRAYLLVFRGPPPVDEKGRWYTGDHINNNHLDNTPANLRWSSIREQNTNRCVARRSVRYVKDFALEDGERVARFPSQRSKWAFTSFGRVIFNGKLRVGARPGRDGYPVVKIDGKQHYVHRIIAHLFLKYDLCDTKHIIMHIDHVKENCSMENLRIGTQQENMLAEAQRRVGTAEGSLSTCQS